MTTADQTNDSLQTSYRVVLTKRGGCSVYTAAGALCDLAGYSEKEAMRLVKHLPVCVGEHLTLSQARCLSRALVEYDMSAEIHDMEEQHVFTDPTHETVFNVDGGLIKNVLIVLASICEGNRVAAS